jgi:dihydropteroate synthase
MRILQLNRPEELKKIMRQLMVDPYGVKIMLPKGVFYLIRVKAISSIAANILKQEMLSLGAEAAVARGALTGQAKKSDCLLMGTLSQLKALSTKLRHQPFGLAKLGTGLSRNLQNYLTGDFTLELGRHRLRLGADTRIMGIVNATPDSFSGDGLYKWSMVNGQWSMAVDYAQKLVADGADIIDVGGESSRPGAAAISAGLELERVIPVIKLLCKKLKVPVSVDTRKPEVARQALDNGAVMVNDISGLRSAAMRRLVSRYKAGVVIMHMRGLPRTMQDAPAYASLMDEIILYLRGAIERAQEAGIAADKIIVDPGIGFGKTLGHNLEIIKSLAEFKVLGRPVMVGVSRKSFLGSILNARPQERVFGTVASCVTAAKNGAKILRVHDVRAVRQALKVADAINR